MVKTYPPRQQRRFVHIPQQRPLILHVDSRGRVQDIPQTPHAITWITQQLQLLEPQQPQLLEPQPQPQINREWIQIWEEIFQTEYPDNQ